MSCEWTTRGLTIGMSTMKIKNKTEKPRTHVKSADAMARARRVLVGGVNSPVRAFNAVGGEPVFIARAEGPMIIDIDGNSYIDYVCSYGPGIFGHAPQEVVTAISKAAKNGPSFGAPTELEVRLAEAIITSMPRIEKVRFVSSGTEALMTAVRLARGVTGRPRIVKFVGCYHGHSDAMLVSAGSGATTLGQPSSPGVPEGATRDTVLVPYNDLNALEDVFAAQSGQIAAVVVEPVAGNMGVIPPQEGFLQEVRNLCDRHGSLLIFDEVITGFRLGLGGAQQVYDVCPDITTLGKIIGGGLPVGAVGANATIMDHLAPLGPIYQAGTLSGNPVAMAAGLATLQTLKTEGFYENLEQISDSLAQGIEAAISDVGLRDAVCLNRVGSMMTLFFAPSPVRNYADATAANTTAFAAYFNAMLERGIYLAPSQFEAMFVSGAHHAEHVEKTVAAAREALQEAAKAM